MTLKDWFINLFVLKSYSILFIQRLFFYFSSWKSKMKFLGNSTLSANICIGPFPPPSPRKRLNHSNYFNEILYVCSVFGGPCSSNAIIFNFLQSVITRRRMLEIETVVKSAPLIFLSWNCIQWYILERYAIYFDIMFLKCVKGKAGGFFLCLRSYVNDWSLVGAVLANFVRW
jgi:hypothetical protein